VCFCERLGEAVIVIDQWQEGLTAGTKTRDTEQVFGRRI